MSAALVASDGSLAALVHGLGGAQAERLGAPLAAAQRQGARFLARGLSWPQGRALRLEPSVQDKLAGHSWRLVGVADERAAALGEAEAVLASLPVAAGPRLVVVDGVPAFALSDERAIDGLSFAPLGTAANGPAASQARSAAWLGSLGLHTDEAFAAMNTALFAHGVGIHVAANTRVSAPIEVIFVTTTLAKDHIIAPRVLIVLEAQAEATVIERHLGDQAVVAWNNAVSEVVCERGARLTFLIDQAAPAGSYHLGTVGVRVNEGAHCALTTLDVGSQFSRRSLRAELLAAGANVSMWHLALARGQTSHVTNATMRHVAGHTESRQVYKGVADAGGNASFAGTVHILRNAPKANAQQLSRGLLLSKTSKVLLRPQLMISTDDVRCQHGATTGALDEDAMFYLQSRGLSPDHARELLTFAFLRDTLAGVPASLQAPLVARMAAWLGADGLWAAEHAAGAELGA